MIDELIKALMRVKNCNHALDALKAALANIIFHEKQFEDGRQKWLNHVQGLIKNAIDLLEKD